MSMKLLFNYRKKTIYLQVAKDHFINMQSAKREFVPRQDLVKLKPGKHTNYLQIVCNAKALEKMHAKLQKLDKFNSILKEPNITITFEIDSHKFLIVETPFDVEIRGEVPTYFLQSFMNYVLK